MLRESFLAGNDTSIGKSFESVNPNIVSIVDTLPTKAASLGVGRDCWPRLA